MTQLTTTNEIELMRTEAERNTYLMMKADKVWQVDVSMVMQILQKAHLDAGKPLTSEDLAYQSATLQQECMLHYKQLTLPELKNAILGLIRGEYGEIFGLNISTYHKAIKSYLESEKTREAKKAVMQRLNQHQEPALSDAEKEAIMVSAFERVKVKVLNGESLLDDMGALGVYGWLAKQGKLKSVLNSDEIQQIIQKARSLLKTKYEADAKTVNRKDRQEANKMLQKLEANLLLNDETVICKKLTLEKLIKEKKL